MIPGALLLVAAACLPWPLVRWSLFTVGFWLVASALWSRVLARFLVVETPFPRERSFSGQLTDVHYQLKNRSWLPTGVVKLTDSAANLETFGPLRHYVSLGPLAKARFHHQLRGRERGAVELGPFTVTGSDPAGLFPFRRVQKDGRELLVYPPLATPPPVSDAGFAGGNRQKDLFWAEDDSRFRSFREFREGDELSRLVASASARWQGPLVRTFDRTRALPALVFVDLRLEAYPLKRRWSLVDEAVEAAAGLLWLFLRRGETVWLSVVGHRAEGDELWGPVRSLADAAVLLETLALVRPLETAVTWDEALWRAQLPPAVRQLWRVYPALREVRVETARV